MRSILSVIQSEFCVNCGACRTVCPAQAIRLNEDDLFYHPEIDDEKCINCGKCMQACPVLSPPEEKLPNAVFYGVHEDSAVVKNSSSGGAFSALANAVLAVGGVVYGAGYDDGCRCVRIRSTDEADLSSFMKSKYVESLTGDSFLKVSENLKKNRPVLYCGAPCQIAGLKRFLGTDPENLYTCDFFCGGFPSHILYQEYLDELEGRYHSKVIQVDFRPKTLGWETHAIRIQFANGKRYHKPAALDSYFSAFIQKHYSVRKICGQCPFDRSHEADITLGDFWQYREFFDAAEKSSGMSLLCANSKKGLDLIEKAMIKMSGRQLNTQHAISALFNKSNSSSLRENQRQKFLLFCKENGLTSAAQKYCLPSREKRMLIRAKSAIKYMFWRVK